MIFKELGNNHALGVEFYGKKIRLVMFDDGVEKVCCKSTIKNLRDFIQSNENHLFKGRLQLHKNGAETAVFVKGQLIGIFSDKEWKTLLES